MEERDLPRSHIRRWSRLRTPRAAAAGGVLGFALLAAVVTLDMRSSAGPDAVSEAQHTRLVRVVPIPAREDAGSRRREREIGVANLAAAPEPIVRPAPVPVPQPPPVDLTQLDLAAFTPTLSGAANSEIAPVLPPPRSAPDRVSHTVTGVWAPSADACRDTGRSGLLLVRIDREAARAGSARCRFGSFNEDGNGWKVVASCSDGAERWTSNVRLAVSGNRLTWSSERGAQTYVRCGLTRTASAQ